MRKMLVVAALFCLALPVAAEEAQVQSLVLRPELEGGVTVRGVLLLDGPVSDEATWIELRGQGPAHPVSVVRVPAGADRVEFTMMTDPVERKTPARVLASLRGQVRSVELLVTPPEAASR